MTHDDTAIEETETAAEERSAAARLFDIRRIIGGLFLLYGLVLVVTGLLDGASAAAKAGGIDINLWTGIGMALMGAFFLGWMMLRPLAAEPDDDPAEDQADDHAARRS